MSTSQSVTTTPVPLNILRLKEIQRILTDYAAEAEKGANSLSGDSLASLKLLYRDISSLSSRVYEWANPPLPVRASSNFWMFPRLPTEIRLMIWRYAMPHARTLVLQYEMRTGFSALLDKTDFHPNSSEAATLRQAWEEDHANYHMKVYKHGRPAVLHVCHESRKEALSKYTLRLDTKDTSNAYMIDPNFDTIYYRNVNTNTIRMQFDMGEFWSDVVLNSIRHLAFDPKRLLGILAIDPGNPLRNFTSLEDVSIVGHSSKCGLSSGFERFGIITLEIPDATTYSSMVSSSQVIEELQRRFSSYLNTKPGWNVPLVKVTTMTLESKVKTKRCCAFTWKDNRDM